MYLFDLPNDDRDCRDLLESLRWPNGIACTSCGSLHVSRITTRNCFDCLDYRKTFSLTAGTVLHKTRIPLRNWLIATYLTCESKKGISVEQLRRMLKLNYDSAWAQPGLARDGLRVFGPHLPAGQHVLEQAAEGVVDVRLRLMRHEL